MNELPLSSPKRFSPLSIIAIFVSLAQSVSTIALIQTSGNVQLYLTYFVILFPLGVAIAFFIILVKKHGVFYAPWEYPTVELLREFLNRPKPTDESTFKSVIQSQIERAISQSGVPNDKAIVKNVMQNIEKAYLTIDTSKLLGKKGSSSVAFYEDFGTVQDLLNYIYYYIREKVPQGSYGESWLLRDAIAGKNFLDMGYNSQFARSKSIGWDTRSLEDVGIMPGMRLEVIPA